MFLLFLWKIRSLHRKWTTRETIGSDLFLKLLENKDKFKLELDNHKFNLQCMEINDMLADSSYFLRLYELKKKFRHLSLKSPKKQTVVRQLSSCIHENFIGFIITIEHGKKLRKTFKPIDIIYKPVKKKQIQKLSVIFRWIYRGLIEIHATNVKSCHMDLATNVIIIINFLQDQTNTNDIWNIALVFRVLFTVLTIKILWLLKIT